MAAARILLLGDDAARRTLGSWWGLGTCCVHDAGAAWAPAPRRLWPGRTGSCGVSQAQSGKLGSRR